MSNDSGDLIHVDFEGLQLTKDQLMKLVTEFQHDLDDLNKAIHDHLNMWEGGAKEAYTQAQTRWNQAADRMTTLVHGLGTTINDVHDIHAQAERIIQGAWSG